MEKHSIRIATVVTAYAILGLVLGAIAYLFISRPISIAINIIIGTLLNVDALMGAIIAFLGSRITNMPLVTLLFFLFFFSLGVAKNFSIPSQQQLMHSEVGGEADISDVVEEPKRSKKKKEEKVKEHVHEHEEHAQIETTQEQPVTDTGNYCQICGKPIPLGRAICKECEEALKRGEIPMTFNIGGGTTQQDTEG